MSCGTPCSLCHPDWLGLQKSEQDSLEAFADGWEYSGNSPAQGRRQFKLCGGCLRRVYGDREPPDTGPMTRQRRMNGVDQLPLPFEFQETS